RVSAPEQSGGRGIERARRIVERYVLASPHALLRGGGDSRAVEALCESWNADCALAIWCGPATVALRTARVGRFAYYGNPDHKSALAMADFDWRHRPRRFDPKRFAAYVKARIGVNAMKRAHLAVMRAFDAVGDVAANDAAFYRRRGVRAFYIRNMWPGGPTADWESERDRREQHAPLKIVANVGNLSATGNTRGIYTLATSVLPALERTLGAGNFELHLFGARRPHPYLTPLLDNRHIRVRGFVDDLDAEILSSPVFLISNNHSEFKVGHTRFLHAWSLGACVVAFRENTEAMPEIVHRRNALLAGTPDEMAALVAEAARDTSLRRALGYGGADALKAQFDPAIVTREIADRLVAIAAARAAAGAAAGAAAARRT
ncbi:MAG TPA: glycosyltransferase family 4 protein, partial [Gemmatimonadaceae bacterium]|nr:glycosyltransferase family 4 protein [Gemmatimonadaceae bacterium]